MSSERTRNTDIKTAVTKTKGHEHKINFNLLFSLMHFYFPSIYSTAIFHAYLAEPNISRISNRNRYQKKIENRKNKRKHKIKKINKNLETVSTLPVVIPNIVYIF